LPSINGPARAADTARRAEDAGVSFFPKLVESVRNRFVKRCSQLRDGEIRVEACARGHTAASIAAYCGLALLPTSLVRNLAFRTAAGCVPSFDAYSRLYRGMHHPLDVAGGARRCGCSSPPVGHRAGSLPLQTEFAV
jgi:hypothetical protein